MFSPWRFDFQGYPPGSTNVVPGDDTSHAIQESIGTPVGFHTGWTVLQVSSVFPSMVYNGWYYNDLDGL